MQRDQNNF